jgi:hypothetical protein
MWEQVGLYKKHLIGRRCSLGKDFQDGRIENRSVDDLKKLIEIVIELLKDEP